MTSERSIGLHLSLVTIHLSLDHRGMVSMVSMEVSKTLGAGSSPATPAKWNGPRKCCVKAES